MNYDDRPWLSSYDADVRPEISIPDQSYPDLLQETFQRFPRKTAYHFLGLTTTGDERLPQPAGGNRPCPA